MPPRPLAAQPAHQLLSEADATAFQPWVRGTSQVRQDDLEPRPGSQSVHPWPSVSGGCLLACPVPTPCTWAHRGRPAASAANASSVFSMATQTHLPPVQPPPGQDWALLGLP